jgi:4-alpha-glucanotransferase
VAARPQLRALAEHLGILPYYQPMAGAPRRLTRDSARELLLAAMGIDASSEAAAKRALAAFEEREAGRLLAPVRVEVLGTRGAERLPVRWPATAAARVDWRVELCEESGRRSTLEGRTSLGGARPSASLPLPPAAEPGYHRLRLVAEGGGERHEAEQRFIACPPRCYEVREALGRGKAFGLLANLYGVRSRRSWGVGDLGDLRALARLAAEVGAAFVGVNPLHASRNQGVEVSPYSPVSRLFRNEIYLAVEAIPELRECPTARRRIADPRFARKLERLRERADVAYDEVRVAKREVLQQLHRVFTARHREGGSQRGRAYARFRARRDPELTGFATFVALGEKLSAEGRSADWRAWPARYRDPGSPAVQRFREEHAEAVDFQRWIQFELERQLAQAAAGGRRAGLPIGFYYDLAVGSAPSGYDTWAEPDLFARGASIGAPPDDFAERGQDWTLPPLIPQRLRETGYDYWIRLLRAVFAHGGALRIDHVMGLYRLWWVPAGHEPDAGAYVRYPARDLLGILALESRRQRALVVGEDLGTVPRGFAARMARWGVLSSRVLYFEREGRGFRCARGYSRRALVTSSTHDLPPLAGFFAARDLELRRRVGAIADETAFEAARRERAETCAALLRRLGPRAQRAARQGESAHGSLAAAVVRFLSRTPAPLVAFSLDDLVGETLPVNLPGVPQKRYPSWTQRMSVAVEKLRDHPTFRRAVAAVPRTRRRGGGPLS